MSYVKIPGRRLIHWSLEQIKTKSPSASHSGKRLLCLQLSLWHLLLVGSSYQTPWASMALNAVQWANRPLRSHQKQSAIHIINHKSRILQGIAQNRHLSCQKSCAESLWTSMYVNLNKFSVRSSPNNVKTSQKDIIVKRPTGCITGWKGSSLPRSKSF